MRRREISKILLTSAGAIVGMSYSMDSPDTKNPIGNKAGSGTTPGIWLDPRNCGCVMDGNHDDYAAFAKCLKDVGDRYCSVIVAAPLKLSRSLTIPANVSLQFAGEGVLRPSPEAIITIQGQVTFGPRLPPWDSFADGANVVTPVSRVLGNTEGVPASAYVSAQTAGLVVPKTNGGKRRFWTACFTLEVPEGAVLSGQDVREDHLSICAHSVSYTKRARIWGMVSAAVNNSAATSNEEAGTCLGGELDINNNSGYDITNCNGDGDVGGLMLASGGNNTAKFGICMSKNKLAKGFFAGWLVRENCIDSRGFVAYFGGIAPAYGLNFGTDYKGGACLLAPTGVSAVEMRVSVGNHARMLTRDTALRFVGGTGGIEWANNTEDRLNATLHDDGLMQAFVLAHKQQQKIANLSVIDASLGGQVICNDDKFTTIRKIANARVAGQQLTVICRTHNTCISSEAAKLSGAKDFQIPQDGTLRLEWDGRSWYELSRKT